MTVCFQAVIKLSLVVVHCGDCCWGDSLFRSSHLPTFSYVTGLSVFFLYQIKPIELFSETIDTKTNCLFEFCVIGKYQSGLFV